MLHLIPPPAARIGLRLAHGARKGWWRIARPLVAGCRVIALDGEERILLVRHSYGSGLWMLPGGGLARGEDPCLAAARELLEETGCRLTAPRLLGRIDEPLHGATNRVSVVLGRISDEPRCDRREIVAAACFAPEAFPADTMPGLGPAVEMWLTAAAAAFPSA